MVTREYGPHSFVVVVRRLPIEGCGGRWVESRDGAEAVIAPVVRKRGGTWIGWSGTCDGEFQPFEASGMSFISVRLSTEEFHTCYEGFSDATIWPLCHDQVVTPRFHRSWWDSYTRVNARFARTIVAAAARGAMVWIHDLHLGLVPEMVRAQRPDLRIGFFGHLPFPSVEQFSQLPWRREMLRGLLGADVIGFQRRSDVDNFIRTCRRLLGIDPRAMGIVVKSYPSSVDVDAVDRSARTERVIREADHVRAELGAPETLILGIDGLDPAKGLLQRLRAFEELLDEGVLDPGRTRLLQVAVPSPDGGAECEDLRAEVERLVGHINGKFAELTGAVVHYSHRSLSFESTVAMYLAADVLLATSLREGMNLVAKEYAVARRGGRGVLVLSEFAGASDELGSALLINPHDLVGLKAAIARAVSMGEVEARARIAEMADLVAANDVHRWADSFLGDLEAGSDGIAGLLGGSLAPLPEPAVEPQVGVGRGSAEDR